MTTILLVACIGMIVGFSFLLGISPMDFVDGVFKQLLNKPKNLLDIPIAVRTGCIHRSGDG